MGEKIAQVEFSDGRPSRVQQFDGSELRLAYHGEGPQKGLLREMSLPDGLQLTYAHDDQGRLVEVTCGGAYRLRYDWDEKGRLLGFKQVRCAPDTAKP